MDEGFLSLPIPSASMPASIAWRADGVVFGARAGGGSLRFVVGVRGAATGLSLSDATAVASFAALVLSATVAVGTGTVCELEVGTGPTLASAVLAPSCVSWPAEVCQWSRVETTAMATTSASPAAMASQSLRARVDPVATWVASRVGVVEVTGLAVTSPSSAGGT